MNIQSCGNKCRHFDPFWWEYSKHRLGQAPRNTRLVYIQISIYNVVLILVNYLKGYELEVLSAWEEEMYIHDILHAPWGHQTSAIALLNTWQLESPRVQWPQVGNNEKKKCTSMTFYMPLEIAKHLQPHYWTKDN